DWRGSMPSRACSSTVSLNLTKLACLRSFTASVSEYSFPCSTFLAASRYFFPCFAILVLQWSRRASGSPTYNLAFDCDAHVAGSAFDLLHRAFQADRVEILHLDLSDFLNLLARQLADLVLVRGVRALLDTCRALDQE